MQTEQRKIRSIAPCSVQESATPPSPPPPRHPAIKDIFVGRQAIFDRRMGIYAYELLYRSSEDNHATSRVAINAFMEMGLEQVVGGQLAFINLTRGFLTGEHPVPFPKDRVVLEVLENIPIDDALVAGVRALKESGYLIALDDCLYGECIARLLDYADIVKIDIHALGMDAVREHVKCFREYPVKLVAEKIETQDEYDLCRELEFDYFQGYFLCRPRVLSGQSMPDNKLAMLRLLAKLQDPALETGELEQLIVQDLSLSYKLMRYVNSAFFSLVRKVESVRQALVYLGNRIIRTWVTLLVMSNAADKPHALLVTALARARMCELLASTRGEPKPDTYFTVGMFSVVDALLDAPMERVLKSLPFTQEVCDALSMYSGNAGKALACVIAYERGEWETVKFADLSPDDITRIYLESIAWADEVDRSL
jgi:EAL and modified HD-GYP domain-containing signal transduction protein